MSLYSLKYTNLKTGMAARVKRDPVNFHGGREGFAKDNGSRHKRRSTILEQDLEATRAIGIDGIKRALLTDNGCISTPVDFTTIPKISNAISGEHMKRIDVAPRVYSVEYTAVSALPPIAAPMNSLIDVEFADSIVSLARKSRDDLYVIIISRWHWGHVGGFELLFATSSFTH